MSKPPRVGLGELCDQRSGLSPALYRYLLGISHQVYQNRDEGTSQKFSYSIFRSRMMVGMNKWARVTPKREWGRLHPPHTLKFLVGVASLELATAGVS